MTQEGYNKKQFLGIRKIFEQAKFHDQSYLFRKLFLLLCAGIVCGGKKLVKRRPKRKSLETFKGRSGKALNQRGHI